MEYPSVFCGVKWKQKYAKTMKTKAEIVENWLPRYTQHPLSDFGEYILLTNFNNYVDIFCEQFKLPQPGYGANMRMATAENITIINFGMGSPNAAIIMVC